ncbi:carboxypeptidase-like regulatory domain-containing protein [Chitinophaga varians]|uniref:carboxypeptidase-like regulatory domain-containing protein n=1 Tax=Chitinophaga varians TaxID=2202339 RepID=UPI00165FF613|nr:carboxypeptidase-like regulatory domain-containing protein [Chitinophaga varians]MBC9910580.1 carboxypeptidase-like regulatory domain-containing protein [Chitinophaga varians]
MRKIPLVVSMPQPCQQPWEDMTPDARGRFCGSCQKSVIDFSILSDSQIVALLSDTSQKYCGRFKKSQLDRLILPEQQAASLLPAAVLSVMLAASVPAAAADNHSQHLPTDTTVSRTITGKVTMEDGALIPGTSIRVKGTKTGTITDPNGHYRLNIPSAPSGQQVVLVFSYIGCLEKEVTLAAQQTVDVVLKPDESRLADEVVIAGGPCVKRATPWQRLKYRWQRLWRR